MSKTESERKRAYQAYIHSGTWAGKRDARLSLDGYACQGCGSREDLHVHHRTYDRFGGAELMDDLITVCESCHGIIHKIHKASGRQNLAGVTDRIVGMIQSGSSPIAHKRRPPSHKKRPKLASPRLPKMTDAERAKNIEAILAKHADLAAACDIGISTYKKGSKA